MKVMISTPCYGGLVTMNYMVSLLDTQMRLMQEPDIEFTTHFIGGESLIPRGRNKAAADFLRSDFDKLLFIDADLSWTTEDLMLLLSSDKQLIGGTYPLKNFPITINYNPLEEHCGEFGRDRGFDSFRRFSLKYANEKGEVEVRHVPTGFLLIDRSVFEAIAPNVETYQSFAPDRMEVETMRDFFPSGAREGEYESEDWAFCRIAKEAEIKVWLQTKIICGHTGQHTYEPGQWAHIGQRPLLSVPVKLES